jgi:hypothetical protein
MSATTARHAFPHPKVRTDWLDLVREDIIDPGLPIVDPHHHLWHERPSGRYVMEELLADLASGHNVVATVFMQCGWKHRSDGPEDFRPVGETEVVNAIAVLSATGAYGKPRLCDGIIAYADLRSPQLDGVLDAHVAAGGGRFRGIRQLVAWDEAIIPTTSFTPPPARPAAPGRARLQLRRLAVSPATEGPADLGARLPRHADRHRPRRRSDRRRRVPGAAGRGVPGLVRRHEGAGRLPERACQARRPGDAAEWL